MDFYAAAIALGAVLLLGILQGILLAALASVLMLLARASQPHVAFLGRIPGTNQYSDMARHPENEATPGVVAFRPEASLIYVNADAVLEAVLGRLAGEFELPDFRQHGLVAHRKILRAGTLAGLFLLRVKLIGLPEHLARIIDARGRVRGIRCEPMASRIKSAGLITP
jgi:hypothetical protein